MIKHLNTVPSIKQGIYYLGRVKNVNQKSVELTRLRNEQGNSVYFGIFDVKATENTLWMSSEFCFW